MLLNHTLTFNVKMYNSLVDYKVGVFKSNSFPEGICY